MTRGSKAHMMMQHHATTLTWRLNEAPTDPKYPYDSETAEGGTRQTAAIKTQQWRNLTGGTFFCEELMASSSLPVGWPAQASAIQV